LSLFVRIFLLFWVAMALIVGASIVITYTNAAREYEQQEFQRRPAVTIQASDVLSREGVQGLRRWLAANSDMVPDRELFIVGPDGTDILGRRLSEAAQRRLDFVNRDIWAGADQHPQSGPPPGPPPGGPPLNFRPSRQAPQIVAADGTWYTLLVVPRRPSIFGALSRPGIPLAVLAVALAVSALASWWLAQHLSAPIRRLQAGARAVATESLDLRVSAGLDGRRDELAVLARDFDAMADQLKANRSARTRLLRDISHELRSPLARMRVALGLARQMPADNGRQLDRLESEIERLDQMIGQVLQLARLRSEDANYAREPVPIDDVIEDIVADAAFEGAAKGCRIDASGKVHASVPGNRELMRSAIENVVRNAVRYSPPSAPVELRVESAGGLLQVRVRDRGPGVPEADLARIFEPFYRVAESRDRNSGGEGIGLAITAQVLKSHGGTAVATNRPEGGLEVRLSIPLVTVSA
jgi:two-component system sensor histidine kinase CpxA